MKTTKLKIKKKARLSRGYITLLKDDLEQICIDANDKILLILKSLYNIQKILYKSFLIILQK